jgi:hypothetical protein
MDSASDQHDVGGKKESVFEYIHEQLAPLKLRSRPPCATIAKVLCADAAACQLIGRIVEII